MIFKRLIDSILFYINRVSVKINTFITTIIKFIIPRLADILRDIVGLTGLALLASGMYDISPILMKCVLGAILFLLALLPYIIKLVDKIKSKV